MKSTAEKKLRIALLHCRRGIAFVAVVAAMALPPATALAAGEESPETTPAAPPASTGWVPQGSDSESSGGGTTEVRHGSSLGSGASPHQAQPESQESTYTPPPSSSYEAPSPAVTSEAPVTTVQTGSGTENVVKHPAVAPPAPKPNSSQVASVAVGTAVAVSQPRAPGGTSDESKVPEAAASSPSPHDQVSSSSAVLPLLAVLVCALILIYAGARLVFGPVEPLRRF
jgi:hypothetical protein